MIICTVNNNKKWKKENKNNNDKLIKPRNILKLPEGTITFGEWEKVLKENLQIDNFQHKVSRIHITDASHLHEYYNANKRIRLFVKSYLSLASTKWAVLATTFTPVINFRVSPGERMGYEYKFSRLLRHVDNVNTPGILLVDLNNYIIVKEYVEAKSYDNIIKSCYESNTVEKSLILLGRCFGRIHNLGIALCDTKPSNFLYEDDKICVVDLEQTRFGKRNELAWDIAEFLYYSAINRNNFEPLSKILSQFISGYLETGEKNILLLASNKKYMMPFSIFVLPNILFRINRLIKNSHN